MQQIRKSTNFRNALLHQLVRLGPQILALGCLAEHMRIEFQANQILSQAVMQFARNPATFGVLQTEQSGRELSQRRCTLLHLRFEIGLGAAQFFLNSPALRHLGLKCLRFLLQVSNTTKAFLFAEQCRVALKRNHVGMFRTDLQKRVAMIFAVKTTHRVGTSQK